MKVNGLDRVEFMVRDMDKALDLFSNTLGMEFLELDEEISKRDGIRCYVCSDTQLHIFSPILPIKSNIPSPARKRLDLLKEHETVFMALTFMVDEIERTRAELALHGVAIQYEYDSSPDYASIGMDNFAELITSPESTLGLVLGFATYVRNNEKEKKHSANTTPVHGSAIKAKSLDRIVIMVRDMKKALDLFSGKLGMEFRELSKEIEERDGNIGYVCHDTHIHLIQPILPLPEGAPLPMKRGAEMLKDRDAIMLLLIFKVDAPLFVSAELNKDGIDTLRTWEENSDYASIGMDHLVEVLVDPEKTIGIPLCFSKWDPC
jgi:catechol 2,3-dioxygenase-like lactoylglutathione lyase family enzyme